MNTHARWPTILITLLGGFAIFANAIAAEVIPTEKRITQIRSYTTYAQIDFDTPEPNVQGCPHGTAERRVAIDWNGNPDRKVMYATVLLAYATNKTVGFQINGCHGSGVPKAIFVTVRD